MKKLISLILIGSLFLVACGPKDTFKASKIKSCSDYFDYLDDTTVERQGGVVHKITCEGVMDFQRDAKKPYGFLIQTENFGEKRIGLHVLDVENDLMLQTMNGQPLTVKGELHIQSPDPNGVGLFATEENIRVIPAF